MTAFAKPSALTVLLLGAFALVSQQAVVGACRCDQQPMVCEVLYSHDILLRGTALTRYFVLWHLPTAGGQQTLPVAVVFIWF